MKFLPVLMIVAVLSTGCSSLSGIQSLVGGLGGGDEVDLIGQIESIERNDEDVEVRLVGDRFIKGVILGVTNISSYVGHLIQVDEDGATIKPVEPAEIVIEKVEDAD